MSNRTLGVYSDMKPNVSDILGSDVRIGYGVAEFLASTITSTVEGGCIRLGNVISRLMHCWYPIGDEMKTQRLVDRGKEFQPEN